MTLGLHILSVIGLVTLAGLFTGWPLFSLAGPDTGPPAPKTSTTFIDASPRPQELPLRVALPPTSGDSPPLHPAARAVITISPPRFDWSYARGDVLSYTRFVSIARRAAVFTVAESAFRPIDSLPDSNIYLGIGQLQNTTGSSQIATTALTFTEEYTWHLFLPLIEKNPSCPATSNQSYTTIPFDGPRADRPGPQHADLNLALRGYSETNEPKALILYGGATDPDAPQLAGLFEPNNFPTISAVFQVNDWVWTGDYPDPGHVGDPILKWPVTLIELPAALGTPLHIPERSPDLYRGEYQAMVLYAEEHRITLNYTRNDTVAHGYTVHLENICVDPNLLALYRAQIDGNGWHVTGFLPALTNDQRLGSAFVGGVRVAIRDRGSFMDPRSGKDWWMGYPTTVEIQRSHDTSLK